MVFETLQILSGLIDKDRVALMKEYEDRLIKACNLSTPTDTIVELLQNNLIWRIFFQLLLEQLVIVIAQYKKVHDTMRYQIKVNLKYTNNNDSFVNYKNTSIKLG